MNKLDGIPFEECKLDLLQSVFDSISVPILYRIISKTEEQVFTRFIQEDISDSNRRRLWFWFEFLLHPLDLSDMDASIPIQPVLDAQRFFTTNGTVNPRYQLLNNVHGNKNFCPLVQKTEELETSNNIFYFFQTFTQNLPTELYVRHLYDKDTIASFQIENAKPNQETLQTFYTLFNQTRQEEPALSVELLLKVIRCYQQALTGFRTTQNFIGGIFSDKERYKLVPPKPEDVAALMTGLLDCANQLIRDPGIPTIVTAAVVSFGLVFIHPFDDGNGRLSRWLLHFVLQRNRVYEGVIPICVSMCNNQQAYRKCLEEFDDKVMPFIHIEEDEQGHLRVTNDTVYLFKYFDATVFAEYLLNELFVAFHHYFKPEIRSLEDSHKH